MNTPSDYQNNLSKEPSDMEQEINSTRERIGRTVEELEQRLSPGQLVDQALGYARDHGGDFAASVASSVRRNPLPMIVTGIGILWLLKSQSSARSRRQVYSPYEDSADMYGDGSGLYRGSESDRSYSGSDAALYTGSESGRDGGSRTSGIRDKLSGVGEAIKSRVADVRSSASSAGSSVSDRLRSTKDSLAERAQGVMSSAQSASQSMRQRAGTTSTSSLQQVRRAKDEFTTLMEEQPLLLGAVGIAVGATIAALVPTTQRERELLGSASDSLADRASELASEKYEELRATASQTVEDFTRSLKEGGDGSQQGGGHTGGSMGGGNSASTGGSSERSGSGIAQGMAKASDKGVSGPSVGGSSGTGSSSGSGGSSSGKSSGGGSVSGSGLSGAGSSASRQTGSASTSGSTTPGSTSTNSSF